MTARNTTSHLTADHDRTVHAVWLNGSELVRYERAGKWYIENAHYTRDLLTSPEAVSAMLGADTVYLDRQGGQIVSRRYRQRAEATR